MRVESGFWSNSRLPKEVQTYCTRHIQGDYNTSVSFNIHHAWGSCVWSVALLTLADPGARGSPDLLTGCIQWGGEGNSSKPHGWAGALQPCPTHTDTPGMGTLFITPTHMWTAKCGFRSILGSWLCGQIWRSSSWRENKMSKQKQQADHQQSCSRCLPTGTEALLLPSAQAAHVTLTNLARCLFQTQPTDQPDKISLQP